MTTISSTFNKPKRRRFRKDRNPIKTQDQVTINRMVTSRRLGRLKVRMPRFKCLEQPE
jgi:hypothetical protein